jgi:hypothetical protein
MTDEGLWKSQALDSWKKRDAKYRKNDERNLAERTLYHRCWNEFFGVSVGVE